MAKRLKTLVILLTFVPLGLVAEEKAAPVPSPESQPMEVLWAPEEPIHLYLNVPATRLDLFVGEQFVTSYQVAIGTPKYPTPIRDYNIRMIIWNPWWIPPESDWAKDAVKTPPGPRNPLGEVKLILEGAMRIHGTNSPRSIGRATSHACLRLHNRDARELAWEIQSRYSEKTDPELLKRYKKNRRSSYYVKLLDTVPVRVDYAQVERRGDRLLLHPNRYWRRGFKEELELALPEHPEIIWDKKLVKKLNRLRRRKTVEVPISDILVWGTPQTPLNPDAAQALFAKP